MTFGESGFMIREMSKNQENKKRLREERLNNVNKIKNGDASGWTGDLIGHIDSDTPETPRLRVLLAKCENITQIQLQLLLKACKKPQHHIARKIVMEKLGMLP